MPKKVSIIEEGSRDGLQIFKQFVPTDVKLKLISMLQDAGMKNIEVTSFVRGDWVPQFADNNDIMSRLLRREGNTYGVLTPNLKGYRDASFHKPDFISVFTAASELFNQTNINCSIEESIERFQPVVEAAKKDGVYVRGAISCIAGCPYEGDVSSEQVGKVAKLLKDIGVDNVVLADTIGTGTPLQIKRIIEETLKHYDIDSITGHYHDTYSQALPNILASLEMGVYHYDSAVAGLGGCPYAKGATGNVATEDVVYMLHGMGIETGIDMDKLIDAGDYITKAINVNNQSRVAKALLTKRLG